MNIKFDLLKWLSIMLVSLCIGCGGGGTAEKVDSPTEGEPPPVEDVELPDGQP